MDILIVLEVLGDRNGTVLETVKIEPVPKTVKELLWYAFDNERVQVMLLQGEYSWGLNTVDCRVRFAIPSLSNVFINLTCYRSEGDMNEDVVIGNDRQEAQLELILDLINKGWIK